jgi:chromosome segregation ATPase
MTTKKAKPSAHELADLARTAEQKLNETVDTAKRLKAKSRDAKRKLKQAKKAAKQAARAARTARKESADARRVYEKAAARAGKARTKASKAREPIVTPKRSTSRRHAARRRHADPVAPPNGVDLDVAFSDADLKALEPQ